MSEGGVRHWVRWSTDFHCALCLKTPEHEAELTCAHIRSKGPPHGGRFKFWNPLPLCSNCNPSARETRGWIRKRTSYEDAYAYWTFHQSRQDVALKLARYGFFEIAVLAPLTESLVKTALSYLDNAFWTCRSLPFPRLRRDIRHLYDRMCGAAKIVDARPRHISRQEELIERLSGGRGKEVVSRFESDPKRFRLAAENAAAFHWRMKPYPDVPQWMLERFEAVLSWHSDQPDETFWEDQDFDRRMRDGTSALQREVNEEDEKGVGEEAEPLMALMSFKNPQFCQGVGVAVSYQRAWLTLLRGWRKFPRKFPDLEQESWFDRLREHAIQDWFSWRLTLDRLVWEQGPKALSEGLTLLFPGRQAIPDFRNEAGTLVDTLRYASEEFFKRLPEYLFVS